MLLIYSASFISLLLKERHILRRGPARLGSHVAGLNFKTSRVDVINASRRCRKLNENSLSLSEL